MTVPSVGSDRGGGRRAGEWVALGLQILVGIFPYGASGLVAPPAGLVVLYAVWALLLLVAWRWHPRNPWAVLIIPLISVGAWLAILSLGEAVLDWTA
jgi:hypothetical protein